MEQQSTNTVKAYAFCLSSSSIRTRVHFFPSAGITTGPFTIACMLTLFGKGIEKKSVMLDGGRLGQPDGVRLEDAFPILRGDLAGIFGLEVQLACQQSRVNLLSSQGAIELISPQFSVMYGVSPFVSVPVENDDISPPPAAGELSLLGRRRGRSGVGIQDAFFSSSLVVVNGSDNVLKPDVYRCNGERTSTLQVGTVSAESAIEFPLDEALFRDSVPHETGWGLVRTEGIHVDSGSGALGNAGRVEPAALSGVGYFVMYRDTVTKRPVSVCAL